MSRAATRAATVAAASAEQLAVDRHATAAALIADQAVADVKRLGVSLNACDMYSQRGCNAIEAMARGAKALLAVDANAIMSVACLLNEIIGRAQMLSNDINCEAGEVGEAYEDEDGRAFSRRIWAEYHALTAAGAQRLKDLLMAIRAANAAAIEAADEDAADPFLTPGQLAPVVEAAITEAVRADAVFHSGFFAALAEWLAPTVDGFVLSPLE
jgi:hypothetical protein